MSRASVLAGVALGAAAAALAFAPAGLAQDRYGPSAYPGVAAGPSVPFTGAPSAAPPSVPLRGRVLSWPGKQDQAAYTPPPAQAYAPRSFGGSYSAAPGPRPYAPAAFSSRTYAGPQAGSPAPYARRFYPGSTAARQPYARPAPLRQAYAQGATAYPAPPRAYAPPASYAAPSTETPSAEGWRPLFAAAPSRAPMQDRPSAPPPALAGAPHPTPEAPSSIYTPTATPEMTPAQRAAAAPPPLRTASAAQRYGYDPSQGHQVRFYSVHRPFGLQPDSAPIPPQFFTATADLSQPAGPLPTDRTTTTTTASGARVSHVAPDTSVN